MTHDRITGIISRSSSALMWMRGETIVVGAADMIWPAQALELLSQAAFSAEARDQIGDDEDTMSLLVAGQLLAATGSSDSAAALNFIAFLIGTLAIWGKAQRLGRLTSGSRLNAALVEMQDYFARLDAAIAGQQLKPFEAHPPTVEPSF